MAGDRDALYPLGWGKREMPHKALGKEFDFYSQ